MIFVRVNEEVFKRFSENRQKTKNLRPDKKQAEVIHARERWETLRAGIAGSDYASGSTNVIFIFTNAPV